jgi:hypothetical protein
MKLAWMSKPLGGARIDVIKKWNNWERENINASECPAYKGEVDCLERRYKKEKCNLCAPAFNDRQRRMTFAYWKEWRSVCDNLRRARDAVATDRDEFCKGETDPTSCPFDMYSGGDSDGIV